MLSEIMLKRISPALKKPTHNPINSPVVFAYEKAVGCVRREAGVVRVGARRLNSLAGARGAIGEARAVGRPSPAGPGRLALGFGRPTGGVGEAGTVEDAIGPIVVVCRIATGSLTSSNGAGGGGSKRVDGPAFICRTGGGCVGVEAFSRKRFANRVSGARAQCNT